RPSPVPDTEPMRTPTAIFLAGLAVTLVAPVYAQTQTHAQSAPPSHGHQPRSRISSGTLDYWTRSLLSPRRPAWGNTSPHDQHRIVDKARRWEHLPPQRQQQIRERIQHWQRMTPAERRRARENRRIYHHLTPGQRQKLHQAYERFKQLPPQQQQKLRSQWH